MTVGLPAGKAGELRKTYPEFVYKGYAYELKAGDLHISFDFAVPPDIKFRPKVVMKTVLQRDIDRVGKSALENLVFHLGLAEMPSYWKATASPKIVIEAGSLNKNQIHWWHDLFMKGMGQYFFENKIDFSKPNFLEIKVSFSKGDSRTKTTVSYRKQLNRRIIVPIGGGKDAIVTYEILKAARQNIALFVLNPKKEQLAIVRQMGKRPLVVERTIDPKLLELNRKGYLNGHTPFSAYLAFLTTLCAALFDYRYIALSNERSSNEGNVRYLGKEINHQYSKSFAFEKKFRSYSKQYLAKDIEYFSFLRPLYELQIAKLLAQYPKYFATFLSCNEAHKTQSGKVKPTGKWCGACAKCLFVFLALYPFAREKTLGIFKRNLLQDKKLKPLLDELTGKKRFKPFECVGTAAETRAALALQEKRDHPLLHAWNRNNFLPARFASELARVAGGPKHLEKR